MNLVDNTGGIVSEPDWASIFSDELEVAAAHERWRIVTTELIDRGLLSAANVHSLQRLVISYLSYERASREVAENGAVLKPRRGNSKAISRINPWFTAMREASADATLLESKLGLSPRDRNAATKADRKANRKRAADAYLKPVS
ncbi:P27 family phage terminase small subunit [Mesorhizobium sp. CN2-181]|uniref:P27 family phage terminase small subunit n=1 Tax=Mesorhizobium yinganensis TaxID=3157707 RepID=UPI0032B74390